MKTFRRLIINDENIKNFSVLLKKIEDCNNNNNNLKIFKKFSSSSSSSSSSSVIKDFSSFKRMVSENEEGFKNRFKSEISYRTLKRSLNKDSSKIFKNFTTSTKKQVNFQNQTEDQKKTNQEEEEEEEEEEERRSLKRSTDDFERSHDSNNNYNYNKKKLLLELSMIFLIGFNSFEFYKSFYENKLIVEGLVEERDRLFERFLDSIRSS